MSEIKKDKLGWTCSFAENDPETIAMRKNLEKKTKKQIIDEMMECFKKEKYIRHQTEQFKPDVATIEEIEKKYKEAHYDKLKRQNELFYEIVKTFMED